MKAFQTFTRYSKSSIYKNILKLSYSYMPNMKSTVGAQQKTATTWTRQKNKNKKQKQKHKQKTNKKNLFQLQKDECPLQKKKKNIM